jgi:Protein of unknown function (DUF2442)
MATKFISTITDVDFEKSSEVGRRLLARGPLAVSAGYANKRIRVELDNGCFFEFPVDHAQGLRGAAVNDLKVIEIQASGLGLHWPALDADLYVPALVKGVLGSKRWMAQIGAVGGSVKSTSKATSSRQNGKLGGRPKKNTVSET